MHILKVKEENPNGSLSYALTLTTGLFLGYWESSQDLTYTKRHSTLGHNPDPDSVLSYTQHGFLNNNFDPI